MAKTKAKGKRNTGPVVWAYCRVSTDAQSLEGQERVVLRYANERKWTVQRFVTVKMSAKKPERARQIEELKEAAKAGEFNTLVVAELSRLGRGSLGDIPRLIEFMREHGVTLHSVREGIDTSKDDITTTVQIAMFSLMAKIEQQLLSERTKAGLEASKASGKKLGRPVGSSKLNAHEDEIRDLVELGVPKTRICARVGCCEATLSSFLRRKRPEWAMSPRTGDGLIPIYTRVVENGNGVHS